MSLWDSIVNDIKGVGSKISDVFQGTVGGFLGTAASGAASIGAQQTAGTVAPQTVQALQQTAQQQLQKTAPIAKSQIGRAHV